jgi:hypothetical protein
MGKHGRDNQTFIVNETFERVTTLKYSGHNVSYITDIEL